MAEFDDDDWLFPSDEKRKEQRKEGEEIAALYRVFVDEPRAKRLLELWENRSLRKRTPPGSSYEEYARDEAIRDFVDGIYRQVQIAKQLDL